MGPSGESLSSSNVIWISWLEYAKKLEPGLGVLGF
jgi:hypothetical protein